MVRKELTFSKQQNRKRSPPRRWPTCSLVGVCRSSVVGLCSIFLAVSCMLLLNCIHCEAVSIEARRPRQASTFEELISGDVDGHEGDLGLDDEQLSQLHPSAHVYTNQFVVESHENPNRVRELAEAHGFNYLGHVSRHFLLLSFLLLSCGSLLGIDLSIRLLC